MSVLRMLPVLVVMALVSGRALAQEEDDDPKSAPRRPAAGAKKAAPASKPAPATEKSPAPTEKSPAPTGKSPAATERSPAPTDRATVAASAATERSPAARAAALESSRRPSADSPAPTANKKLDPPAAAKRTVPDPVPAFATLAQPRPVRVRLLDGSTVVGQVRAEQPEALVIDCALGQLAIPRARISTIAYDAAAGAGNKRAPVQQLDDDPKR